MTRPGPKVTSFIEEAPKLFDNGHSDLKDIIRKDTLRTSEAKEEDIAYYMAKVEGKYAKLDCSQDKSFKEKVERKVKRIQKKQELLQKEKERLDQHVNLQEGSDVEEGQEYDEFEVFEDIETDETPKSKKIRRDKKPDLITLNLPRKTLSKLTAPLARRYHISPWAQTAFLAKIIKIGGGNVEDFVLSKTSAHRHGKKAIQSESEKIVEEKKEKLRDKNIQLHFDGKSVKHFMEGNGRKERVAVIASSPEMEEEILLGIPAVPTSSGIHQVSGILPLIEKYELSDNIFSVNIDSTASNTGKWAGSATLLQKKLTLPMYG